MSILSVKELRELMKVSYSNEIMKKGREKRIENIDSFLEINRDGLEFGIKEKRILLYETSYEEKIFIQYPGAETKRNRSVMPMDFRPELQLSNGKFLPLATFGWIWDVLDKISDGHKNYLDLVAVVLFKMGYLIDYDFMINEYDCYTINPLDGEVLSEEKETIHWNKINFSKDVWESLNNYIGEIHLEDDSVLSFEGFIKFFDLLLQNEDCKYYYRNYINNRDEDYRNKLDNGRISTIHTHLLIVSYLQGDTTISELLNAFQRARGVPSFPKFRYPEVSKGLITRE